LYVAAAAAGIATGNIVGLPLTNKVLTGNGVENANAGAQLTVSQLSQLQNNGVLPIWQTAQNNGPPTLLTDITTWQVDNNPENTSSQQVACRYWLAYSVTSTLQQYVGTIAAPTTEATILNAVKRLLNALIYTGGSSNGVLASWDTTSLKLTYNGSNQLASILVNVQLIGQNKFITCFATVEPLTFTITST
jgi:spore germination protein GerM